MIGELVNEDMENKKRSLTFGPCETKTKKDKEIISPPAKRLKQARLPFKPVTSPNQAKLPSPPLSKKTKASETPSPFSSSHGKARQGDKRTSPSKKADTPQPKKQSSMKGKKIGFACNGAAKTTKVSSSPPNTEVSSSSEDTKPFEKECDSTVGNKNASVTTKKAPKSVSMDCFVQTTQQPQVSTSDIIDLSDADDEMEDEEDLEPSNSFSGQIKDSKSEEAEHQEKEEVSVINTSISSVSSLEQMSSEDESSDDEEEEEEEEGDEADSEGEPEVGGIADKDITKKDSGEADASSSTQEVVRTTPSTPVGILKPPHKTPTSAKALMRLKEAERKKNEKLKQREEKKRKLEEEMEVKKRMKLEHRHSKDEEKELLRKKKLEEKKQKQAEKQQKKEQEEQEKLEKKKAKEEERRKKQQEVDEKQGEKKKKQEEKLKQEEEKKQKEAAVLMKKEKQSQVFKSFFKVQAPVPVKKAEVQGRFVPFEVKKDMVLAPCIRVKRENLDFSELDQHFHSQSGSSLYLDQLKSGAFKKGRSPRTPAPIRPAQDSMEVDPTPAPDVPSKKKQKQRKPDDVKMKMLQFHENYRPAYYGSWRKETSTITGRKPFKKDEDVFDYEFDSDDEWEEPGESLSHSEGEDEDGDGDGEGDGDDEEEEDGFFVPHGYLSAGEGGEDEDDKDHLKARQAAKAKAWENELRRRCEALKPMIITFIQVESTNKTRQQEKNKLEAYRAVPLVTVPIATSHTKNEKAKGSEESGRVGEGGSLPQARLPGSMRNKLKPVPDEAMADLVSLVHGNTAGIKSLIREFRDFWRQKELKSIGTPLGQETSTTPTPAAKGPASPVMGVSPAPGESPVAGVPAGAALASGSSPSPLSGSGGTPSPHTLDQVEHVISKRQLDLKINAIAVREKRPDYKRICWYVHQHILEKYKMEDLPVPTSWMNGLGLRDRNASPLPPTNIAPVPPAAMTTPPVNRPAVIKLPKTSPAAFIGSLGQAAPAQSTQPIFIPSGTMPSAFNKVGAVHLAGVPGASVQPIAYVSPGGALLQPGLTHYQVMPMSMQQAINPGSMSVSAMLQQAAANSLLKNMNPVQTLQPLPQKGTNVVPCHAGLASHNNVSVANHSGVSPNNASVASASKPKQVPLVINKPQTAKVSPPKSKQKPVEHIAGSHKSPLPSMTKESPKRLDAVIDMLHKSTSLSPAAPTQEKPKPAPVKKTPTIASFFNVKTTKQPVAKKSPESVNSNK